MLFDLLIAIEFFHILFIIAATSFVAIESSWLFETHSYEPTQVEINILTEQSWKLLYIYAGPLVVPYFFIVGSTNFIRHIYRIHQRSIPAAGGRLQLSSKLEQWITKQ